MSSHLDTVINLFQQYFFNRTDKILLHTRSESNVVGKPRDLKRSIRAHILGPKVEPAEFTLFTKRGDIYHKGHPRIGTYCPSLDGSTRWCCIDVDGANHSDGVHDPHGTTIKVFNSLKKAGFSPLIEKSFSGEGFHIWVFFDQPIEAQIVTPTIRALLPEVTLANSVKGEESRKAELEIFPKNFHVRKGGVGSAVWLPLFHQSEPENNQFYKLAEGRQLLVGVNLGSIKTTKWEDLNLVKVNSLDNQPGKPVKELKFSNKYKDWRDEALSRLPLSQVYGKFLIDSEHCEKEWLLCRDPWSPSGDQTPSAGVASGLGASERGRFSSLRTGESFSVFDFLGKLHNISFQRAKEHISELSGVPLPPRSGPTKTWLS